MSRFPIARFSHRLVLLGLTGIALASFASLHAGDAAPSNGPDAQDSPARYLAAVDLDGHSRQPFETSADAVALVFITTECPLSRQYIPELKRLADTFAEQSVDFYAVLSDPTVTRQEAAEFAREFDVTFPVLFDASGELAVAFAPTHVPEAFLLDPDAHVVYRGRIDDRYADVNVKRDAPQTRDFADAVAAHVAGDAVAIARTEPVGCLFEAPAQGAEAGDVTYTRHVAPILYAKCAECHRPGEVAPFSLLTYQDAAKRAAWIRDVTTSGLMPPWQAELGHGRFLGERRLTTTERDLIARWAETDAPEGDPADLPPEPTFATGWRLGEPDLVVEAPDEFTVPADGPDVFQHWVIPLGLDEDRTLVGFEFRPGNPAVVHHAVLVLDTSGFARAKDAETEEPGYTTFGSIGTPSAGIVGVWTPGMTPRFLPENTGMVIPGGAELVMEIDLNPTGDVETDH